MPIFRGTNNIKKIFRGNNEIVKVFRGNNLIFQSFQFPQYEELADINVTTATTQIDFNNLNITKDDELRLVYTFKGIPSVTTQLSLFANGNTTATNYHSQELVGFGSTLVSFRYNLSYFNNFINNGRSQGYADIKISNNDRFVVKNQYVRNIGGESSSIHNFNFNIVGTGFTLTNITSLSLIGNRTNGIEVGSRLQLYKAVK